MAAVEEGTASKDSKEGRSKLQQRATVKRVSDEYSNTQQLVYLGGGADISGFNITSVACKVRQKEALKNDRLSRQRQNSDGSLDPSYSRISPTEPDSGQRETKSSGSGTPIVSPGMLRWIALKSILLHPFSLLLVCFPLGIYSGIKEWDALYVFWFNIIAMIPLAKILGDATEELADAIQNDTLSGLLNATLGNAVEMILTVQTLRKGLLDVVKATLLGSILSNLLLVLGSSFFLGGLSASSSHVGKYHVIHTPGNSKRDSKNGTTEDASSRCITMEKEQLFTVKGALVNVAMHLLSIMTIALPTVMGSFSAHHVKEELLISRCGSLVITSSYIAYITFHLATHKEMLAKDERNLDDEGEEPDDEEEGGGGLGGTGAVILMVVTTIFIGVSSEFLVEAIVKVVQKASMPSKFIGVILLPFAGNACEHASALRFAMIDRPGLSIGIAVGSSTQIALLVVPFAVIMGWVLDKPMDLNFGVQDTTILFLSTLVVLALVLDGRSNWLKGFLLCNTYIFTGLLYWFG